MYLSVFTCEQEELMAQIRKSGQGGPLVYPYCCTWSILCNTAVGRGPNRSRISDLAYCCTSLYPIFWHFIRFVPQYGRGGFVFFFCRMCMNLTFYAEYKSYLFGQRVFSRAFGRGSRRGAACTPRRKCGSRPSCVARALGVQTRKI